MRRIAIAFLLVACLATAAFAAGDIRKEWGSSTWIEGSDGSGTTLDANAEYSSGVELQSATNGWEGAHVMCVIDIDDSSPVDSVIVQVLGSLDGSEWATIPQSTMYYDEDDGDGNIDFVVRDLAHFRLNSYLTGSTDTTTTIECYYEAWKWYAE